MHHRGYVAVRKRLVPAALLVVLCILFHPFCPGNDREMRGICVQEDKSPRFSVWICVKSRFFPPKLVLIPVSDLIKETHNGYTFCTE